METAWMLLRVLFMSAVVAGLAYLTAGVLRQRALRLRRGSYLELIDALTLGGRHHLALVRAGTRVICVGVSAEGLRRIAEFEGDDARALLAQASPVSGEEPGSPGLAGYFRRLLERRLDASGRGDW